MDFVALQISTLAVLSPFLFAVGVLQLLSASSLGGPTLALNLLTVALGGLRLGLDLPPPYSILLTVLLVFLAALTLVADGRLCHRFWKVLSAPQTPVRTRVPVRPKVPKPTSFRAISAPAKAASRPEEAKRVQILSPSAWVLHNDWGDIRVHTVPPAIIERKKGLADSNRNLRITFDADVEPLEDVFRISPNFQILLPPEYIDRLQGSERIQFEILDTPVLSSSPVKRQAVATR